MIDGVNIKPPRTIPDQRGRLTELNNDDDPDEIREDPHDNKTPYDWA